MQKYIFHSKKYSFILYVLILALIEQLFLTKLYPYFRYVYKFVCDLQSLLGYSPEELQAMVAQQQHQQQQHSSASSTLDHPSMQDNPSTPPISQPLKREID